MGTGLLAHVRQTIHKRCASGLPSNQVHSASVDELLVEGEPLRRHIWPRAGQAELRVDLTGHQRGTMRGRLSPINPSETDGVPFQRQPRRRRTPQGTQ
jgi:hypothetical protein